MFNKIKLVINNKDLMKRILITFLILFVYKIATHISIPLLQTEALDSIISESGFLEFLNTFSGGALERFSVVALGISPYITASIVIQLLQMDIIPVFKEWSEQGEQGKQKLNQVTRYVAIGLAFVNALMLLIGFSHALGNELLPGVSATPLTYVYMAMVVTAGTAFLLWLSDLITLKGVGNGTSMLIIAGILTSLPSMFTTLMDRYVITGTGGSPLGDMFTFVFIILLYLGVLIGVIYMQIATRKIPIQHANRKANSDSNIPIKLNSAGVIPVIFASTLLSVPLTVVGMVDPNQTSTLSFVFNTIFNYTQPIGFILYIILIYLFTFFYAFMTVNPEKISDNLSKQNAYIPGIRPGEDTERYVGRSLFKVTLIGSTYLAILAAIPILTAAIFGLPQIVTIGGTSLLIIVGVAIETTKQIETDATKKTYSGFIK